MTINIVGPEIDAAELYLRTEEASLHILLEHATMTILASSPPGREERLLWKGLIPRKNDVDDTFREDLLQGAGIALGDAQWRMVEALIEGFWE